MIPKRTAKVTSAESQAKRCATLPDYLAALRSGRVETSSDSISVLLKWSIREYSRVNITVLADAFCFVIDQKERGSSLTSSLLSNLVTRLTTDLTNTPVLLESFDIKTSCKLFPFMPSLLPHIKIAVLADPTADNLISYCQILRVAGIAIDHQVRVLIHRAIASSKRKSRNLFSFKESGLDQSLRLKDLEEFLDTP